MPKKKFNDMVLREKIAALGGSASALSRRKKKYKRERENKEKGGK